MILIVAALLAWLLALAALLVALGSRILAALLLAGLLVLPALLVALRVIARLLIGGLLGAVAILILVLGTHKCSLDALSVLDFTPPTKTFQAE